MDSAEAYSFLFADSLMEALLLPPHTAYILRTMLSFGGFEPMIMLFCASAGAILGAMGNWALGRIFITCRDKEWVIVETPKLDKCTAFFRKYLSWLAFFAWFPGLGGIITVIAGFSKIRFWLLTLWVSLGFFAYHILILHLAGYI